MTDHGSQGARLCKYKTGDIVTHLSMKQDKGLRRRAPRKIEEIVKLGMVIRTYHDESYTPTNLPGRLTYHCEVLWDDGTISPEWEQFLFWPPTK